MSSDVGLDVAESKPLAPSQNRDPLLPPLGNGCSKGLVVRCILLLLSLGALIAIIVLAVALANARADARNAPEPIVTAPTPASPTSAPTKFRIVTYNDVYDLSARNSSSDPLLLRGGAAYVAGYVKSVREVEPNTLVLLAGDTISPSLMSQFFYGSQMIHAHNAIGLNYSCLGNHEFDMGLPVLRQRIAESNFTWLNANVYEADGTTLFAGTVPHVVVDFGFAKVGIFGLLYQAGFISASDAVIKDPLVVAAAQIAELRGKGANFVVALTHQFYADSCKIAGLPGINLVVTGHDHEMQTGGCPVPVLVATSDWTDVWDVTVDFGRAGGAVANASNPKQVGLVTVKNVPITNQLVPVPSVEALVASYESQVGTRILEVVGNSSEPLDVRGTTVRVAESAFANFVLDYLRRDWVSPVGESPAVALLNGGGFRSDKVYPAGNITRGTVLSIFPFLNVMPLVWLTGAELKLGLEECFTRSEFPQVSGISYQYSASAPKNSKVIGVRWAHDQASFPPDTAVSDSDMILFATNDFMLDLLDSWANARTNTSRVAVTEDEAPLLSSLVIEAVQLKSPIAPTVDGRITMLP